MADHIGKSAEHYLSIIADKLGSTVGAIVGVVLGNSTAHIGQVGGHSTMIAVTPTITTAAYTANDAVGGKLTFANAVRAGSLSGIIQGVTVIDKDKENAALTLVLFNQDFTATADADAFDPTDADLANCIGHIAIAATDYASFNDNSEGTKNGIAMPFTATTTSIYGQLMCTGTPTYTAASDLTVKLRILQD